jgi:hypothetical protein
MLRDLCECSSLANPFAAQLLKGEAVPPAEGWKVIAEQDGEPAKGIKVERLDGYKGRAPGMIRCTTALPGSVPPRSVSNLMTNLELRSAWDPHAKIATAAQQFGADAEFKVRDAWISHTGTKSALGGLVSPRDFINYAIDCSVGEGRETVYCSVSQSIEHPDHPVTADAIRGEAVHSTMCYTPAPAGALTPDGQPAGWICEYIVQVELHGWLPRGPILSGTIDNMRDFLRYLAVCDWASVPEPEGGGGAQSQ